MKRILLLACAVLLLPLSAGATGRTGHTCPDLVRDPMDTCIQSVKVDTLWRTLTITGINLCTGTPTVKLGRDWLNVASCAADGTTLVAILNDADEGQHPLAIYVDGDRSNTVSVKVGELAGPQGPQGPAGPTGPAGAVGPMGLVGPIGPIGPQGIKGDSGATGAPGLVGPMGPTGPAGPAGPEGPMGMPGRDGVDGFNGADGKDGAVGPAGPKGDKGEAGAIGAAGPAGPQGAPGVCSMPTCPIGQLLVSMGGSQWACRALCGGTLPDLSSDPLNCGTCGNSCGGFMKCVSGACATGQTTVVWSDDLEIWDTSSQPRGWTRGTIAGSVFSIQETSVVHSGNSSAKVVATNGWIASDGVAVEPNTYYEVSAWGSGLIHSSGAAYLQIIMTGCETGLDQVVMSAPLQDVIFEPGWHQFIGGHMVSGPAPSGCSDTLQIRIGVSGTSAFYVDDVQLSKTQ